MSLGSARSSGSIAAGATTVVVAQSTLLRGIAAVSDGTNVATVIAYDNASASSGTILAKVSASATQGQQYVNFATPIKAENGITVAVTGTGTPTAIVYTGA